MADMNASTGRRPIDLARDDEMRQAIVNEEKRRRDLDLSFKRAVIPPNPTTAEQDSNEYEEEAEDGDDDVDSGSSDEEDEN